MSLAPVIKTSDVSSYLSSDKTCFLLKRTRIEVQYILPISKLQLSTIGNELSFDSG